MGCGRIWKSVVSPDISSRPGVTATADMTVLPGVLWCRILRRTIQVHLGFDPLRLPGGTSILFALAALRSVPQAGSQFHGLATPIREISGLGRTGARAISDSRRLKRAIYNIPQSKLLNLHSEIIEAPLLLSPLDTDTSGVEGFVSVTNAWWFVNGVFRRVSAN